MYRPTQAVIDLGRLKENYRVLKAAVSKEDFFCPMVKANAYGHGDLESARALRDAGAEHLGVALIEEGLRLRQAGDQGSILVFGPFDEHGARALMQNDLTPVANDLNQLAYLSEAARKLKQNQIALHLEFNTGMNRLGFEIHQAEEVHTWLKSQNHFRLAGLCTHFLSGDDAGIPGGETEKQIAQFKSAVGVFKGLHFKSHLLNSSACAYAADKKASSKSVTELHGLGARVGIAMYGIQPAHREGALLNLQPVLSLKTQLTNLHHLKTGECVSYGPSWRATRESVIGVVPVGYADGYSRLLSNRAQVLCRGKRAPLVGTVCMDYFMIDLTDIAKASSQPPVQIGEEVVLIGEQLGVSITAEELARQLGTISYEILTSIGSRVSRIYK